EPGDEVELILQTAATAAVGEGGDGSGEMEVSGSFLYSIAADGLTARSCVTGVPCATNVDCTTEGEFCAEEECHALSVASEPRDVVVETDPSVLDPTDVFDFTARVAAHAGDLFPYEFAVT